MKNRLLLFCFLSLGVSCSDNSSTSLSKEELRIAEAYAEIILLNQRYQLSEEKGSPPKADSFESQRDSVLLRYGLDRREFESEFLRLSQSPEKFKSLFEVAEQKLKESH